MGELIVPTLLPTGALHFATVPNSATISDVISILSSRSEVVRDVLGDDLSGDDWAMQRIRTEANGRQWEEDELNSLGDGILNKDAAVEPLIAKAPDNANPARAFSAFALTSHLHAPSLRLVSLHPNLCVTLSFLRVPEIHDGFTWRCFLARTVTVQDAILAVVDELGLTKTLPIPGGGNLEYVLEEVWIEEDTESECYAR
ncbi:hypothetical protein PENSPDRAFT_624395 [Peniophora sp. CONT]|nr:hypothetical protein PENSPDRAFT_624395 [Peniophora sp. CONT]